MKRILALLTELYDLQYKGGMQVFNSFLVKALIEVDYTLKIVSMNDKEKSFNLDSHPLSFRASRKYKPLRKLTFFVNTLKQTFQFKPVIILCGHVNFSPLCMMISKLFNVPYITVTHGIDAWNLNGLKLKGLKNSYKIISVSKFTKNKILEQLQDYKEKDAFILPNTFDSERFKPGPRPEYLMKRWGIGKEEKVIFTLARLSKSEKYKGYDKVIMALKNVLKEVPSVRYIIGGSGDDMDRIKNLIRENTIENRVILPGFIPEEELVDYYNLCDVFVMPSKGEGFGIVFLEALSCGKPVIAGNKDGSVDAILDGEVGILVDPDNLSEIKQAILNVLNRNCEQRLLDKEYLRKRIINEFGFDKYKERLKTVLMGM